MTQSNDQPTGSRRLQAVLLADMTGFSKLMGEDESRAVAALMRIRNVFASVVPRHGGTLDVLVGDCFVALFDSAVEAVRAAIAIQTELAAAAGPTGDPLRIRIGLHLGEVVRSGAEILGDSVNVAARLQTVAKPGGIAVSEDVFRAVRNRVAVPFRDMGPRALKNIREKVRVYEIHVEEATAGHPTDAPVRSLRPFLLAATGVAVVASLAGVWYRLAQQPGLLGVPSLTSSARQVEAPPPAAPPQGAPLMVGVTGVSARGDIPAWMQDNTRDGLNTMLSKVSALRVFSREKIDFLRQRRGLSEIEVAETLGIQKMISGTMVMDGGEVVLEARVVDISTGILDASESMRGPPDGLIELQNQLASSLLTALGVRLSADQQAQLFSGRTRDTLDGYRRMAETFGEAPAEPRTGENTSWLIWPRPAWGQTADDAEPAIRALLEAYRAALEHEDVKAVAATHVELSDEQRTGFERYFESAEGLSVALNDVDVLVEGNEALVTFTRRDVFHDRNSGKELQLEVRLSSIVVQQDGRWLMRGVKRSS